MFRFIFRSKFVITSLGITFLALACMGCWELKPNDVEGKKYVVNPYDAKSKDDLKWSEYLYRHLKKRGGDFAPVFYDQKVKDCTEILFHLDKGLDHDFVVENKGDVISLTAKSVSSAIWLIHQYMRHVGDEDDRFPANDLPAAILSFADTVGDFSFKYRDVYAPAGLDEDTRGVLDLNCIDDAWGIWGHNIGVTVSDKSDQNIYASIKGERHNEQYCFTSEKLYHYVEKYINTNYGKGFEGSMNFAILPNDNNLVCQCPGCVAEGNTPQNATPAVTSMIKRLAARFKQHKFFTSSYLTTKTVTEEKMPDNVGVLVSVIDWQPSSKHNDPQKQKLEVMIDEWRKVCKHIYIWDYINNYDDYFTPYPILLAMQERFRFYKEKGIEGVFLNGSGYEYSTFSDMETCVLAALMMNVDLDVERLMRDYFQRMYPVAGTTIADFYSAMLKNWNNSKKVMPYYGGIDDKVKAYLNPDEFVDFYHKIINFKKLADDDEAYLLRRLITALSYTRLEMARYLGTKEHGFAYFENNTFLIHDDVHEWLTVFNDDSKVFNFKTINESGDLTAHYVNSWKQNLLSLKHIEQRPLSQKFTMTCHEGTFPMPGLSDGQFGIPVNYYYGWNIMPYQQVSITVPAEMTRGGGTLAMNLFSYVRHRIQLPSKIEIYDGKKLLSSETMDMSYKDGAFQTRWEKTLPQGFNGKVTLKLYATGKYHLAVDELFMIN